MSLVNNLKKRFDEASTTQKVSVGAVTVAGALLLHPVIIAGAIIGGASAAGVAGYNATKDKGPKQ